MSISTQIIGKDSAIDGGLFRLKQRLELLGVIVRHPLADRLVRYQNEMFTYRPKLWTPYEVWLDFFESIKSCDLHIASNDVGGLIGHGSSLAIAYAMMQNKPIIATNKPYFRPEVDGRIAALIAKRRKELNIQSLIQLDNTHLQPYVELVAAQRPRYRLSTAEKTLIERSVRDLLRTALG